MPLRLRPDPTPYPTALTSTRPKPLLHPPSYTPHPTPPSSPPLVGLSDASGACLPALLPGFECVLNAANPRGGGGWLNFSNPGMPLGARMQVTSIDGGKVNVSIAAYLRGHAWEQIQTLTENGFPYDATLLSFNEKGAVADVEGLPGFIPWSHWYLPEEKRDMAELEKLKGQTLTVEFLEVDPQRRRLLNS